MMSKYFEIGDDLIEVWVGDLFLGESRHRADPMTDLKFDHEAGERFIIEHRTDPGLSLRTFEIGSTR